MEVTSKTDCSFVSIDGEFTGLRVGRSFQLNLFDTAEERYRKHSAGSGGMFMLEVGISLFRHVALDEYKVDTFNFLISPRNPHFGVRDRYFTCQTSSLDLLYRANFSFDKCFRDGVTYVSENELADCQKVLQQRAGRRNASNGKDSAGGNDDVTGKGTPKTPWWQEFEENICKKLDEAFLNNTETMGLSDFTEEERNVLLRVIERKYADKFVLLSSSVARMTKPEDWLQLHLGDLDKCLGFTRIVRQISESAKPVVGHNIYLDIIHLYRQFIGPLPDSYEEAKSLLHKTFPKIIDTKLVASMEPVRDWVTSTALPELYKAVQNSPFKMPKLINAAYGNNSGDHLHQAGYDSYITGVVFTALAEKLCRLKDEKPGTFPLESVSIASYFNKVFMFRSWDYNFVSLDRPDATPARKGVFYVTFPAIFRTENLLDLFKSLGKVQIGWINDTSAYVGLNDADQAPFAIKRLCSNDSTLPPGVRVTPWAAMSSKRKSSGKADDTEQANGPAKKAKTTGNGEMFEVPSQW